MLFDEKEDYYEILNIDKSSSFEEIKRAYKESIKKYHPDLNKEKNSEFYFKKILKAYTILSDPDLKKEYDNSLIKDYKNKFKYNIDKFIQKKDAIFKKINIFFKNISIKLIPNKKICIKEIDDFFLNKIDYNTNLSLEEIELRLKYSENEYLRSIAAIMLGYKEERKAVFLLEEALKDTSIEVRLCAVWALGYIGMKKSIHILKKIYKESCDRLKIIILYSIFRISKASFIIFNNLIKDSITNDSPEVKKFVKNLYSHIKNEKIESDIILNSEKVIFAGLNN